MKTLQRSFQLLWLLFFLRGFVPPTKKVPTVKIGILWRKDVRGRWKQKQTRPKTFTFEFLTSVWISLTLCLIEWPSYLRRISPDILSSELSMHCQALLFIRPALLISLGLLGLSSDLILLKPYLRTKEIKLSAEKPSGSSLVKLWVSESTLMRLSVTCLMLHWPPDELPSIRTFR